MKLLYVIAVTTSLVALVSSNHERPIVESPSGKYKGHILKTNSKKNLFAFQGIPYALPPVGNLRFKDPVKMPKLEEVLDAKDDSKECRQFILDYATLGRSTAYKGTEDCLYLNVYTPAVIDKNKSLPVYVWIHSGGYEMGSGSTYAHGPGKFLEKDMILVTTNYRLGVLGFLSTGDSILPGNLGMKDQVMALQWVKENIEAFGGDPNLITVGGDSSGAASVVQLMHSKMSKDLFHRGIAQSGTMDGLWATKSRKDARTEAEKYAEKISCPIEQETFIKCLQDKPLEELDKANNEIKDPLGIFEMIFVPVIEEESPNAFLTESSIRTVSDIPLIIGVTNYESLNIPTLLVSLQGEYAEMSSIGRDQDRLFPLMNYYKLNPDSSKITKELVKYYFGEEGINNSSKKESIINMNGDLMFNYPMHVRSQKHKGPVYKYMFSYKSKVPLNPFIPKGLEHGVAHAEDQIYFFDFKLLPNDYFREEDRELSRKLMTMYYDFMITGNPTPESKQWEESDRGVKYLDITNQGFQMKTNMFQTRMKFLEELKMDLRPSLRHDEL